MNFLEAYEELTKLEEKDLTRVKGCYSKELRDGCNDIKLLVKDPSTSVDQMKEFVLKLVEPAYIEAEAKQRFRDNLSACETKEEIDELCRQVVLHGMYYDDFRRNR